jgi:hypothetical protein
MDDESSKDTSQRVHSPSDAVMIFPTDNSPFDSARSDLVVADDSVDHDLLTPQQTQQDQSASSPVLQDPVSMTSTPFSGQGRSSTTKIPSNPFYTGPLRVSTPPPSSDQSPIVSPAKRFSTGEVKPIMTPNSPLHPLSEVTQVNSREITYNSWQLN